MDTITPALDELMRLNEDVGLIKSIVKVMEAFEEQNLEGIARGFALEYLHLLLRKKPLTVLTSDTNEWRKMPGEGMWQSRRDPEAFSYNHGHTYWLASEADMCDPEPPPLYRSADPTDVVMPETYRDHLKLRNVDPGTDLMS